ncbi:hypothetical protein ACU686_31770 [Yinghuangia aomiensis]
MGAIAHVMTDFARGRRLSRGCACALVVAGYVTTGPCVLAWFVTAGGLSARPRDLLAEIQVDTVSVDTADIVFSMLPTIVYVVGLGLFCVRWATASRILRRGWTTVLLGNIGMTGVYVYTGLMIMVPALRSTYGTGIAASASASPYGRCSSSRGLVRARAGRIGGRRTSPPNSATPRLRPAACKGASPARSATRVCSSSTTAPRTATTSTPTAARPRCPNPARTRTVTVLARGRRDRPRPRPRRVPGPGARGRRDGPPADGRTSGCTPKSAPSSPRSALRAPASWKPASTARPARSNETSTTAPSSASSRSP